MSAIGFIANGYNKIIVYMNGIHTLIALRNKNHFLYMLWFSLSPSGMSMPISQMSLSELFLFKNLSEINFIVSLKYCVLYVDATVT